MACLNKHANIHRPDVIYQRLMELHEGRNEAESLQINAELILVLINHIGDEQAISEAIALVARAFDPQMEPLL